MKENWRLEMRQKMEGYKKPAPELSWSEIYRTMPTPHVVLPIWIKHAAAVAVVLLIAGIGIRFLHVDDALPEQPVETLKTDEPQQTEQERQTVYENIALDQTDNEVQSEGNVISVTAMNPAKGSAAYETYTENSSEPEAEITESVNRKKETDDRQPAVVKKTEPFHTRMDLPLSKRKKKNRLMAMAYVSNYMSDSYHIESYSQTNITKEKKTIVEWIPWYDYLACANPDNISGSEVFDSIFILIPVTRNETVTTVSDIQTDHEYRHYQPIRFGMMFQYRLSDHWTLESGLSYTRLVSEITTRVDGQITDISQQCLHYIGIPVNLGYHFRIYKRSGMYFKAGGTIDKMLNSSSWQFSLNGAAGIDYELTDRFNLYLEPGFGYYFNDGSSISTIYKDHPLNFNLSIGLRFNIN